MIYHVQTEMRQSLDHDQTAPSRTVWSWSALFVCAQMVRPVCPKNLQYTLKSTGLPMTGFFNKFMVYMLCHMQTAKMHISVDICSLINTFVVCWLDCTTACSIAAVYLKPSLRGGWAGWYVSKLVADLIRQVFSWGSFLLDEPCHEKTCFNQHPSAQSDQCLCYLLLR